MSSLPSREFEFSDRDFNRIRTIIAQHAGISLSDSKRELVYGRLARRLRSLGLARFEQYCELLERDPDKELGEFVNALTTNLTAFFREAHHFDYLQMELLPRLREEKTYKRCIRIWSAGCSTGEEPYSIAMIVREVLPATESWDVKILATDLDTNVLETGRLGIYEEEKIKGLSQNRLQRWFLRGKGSQSGLVKAVPELREMICFRQLNLIGPWPMQGRFDIIFCRNVVIYFDKPTQRKLFERFADILDDRGCLFVGHSESLYKVTDRFVPLGKTIYGKSG